jgi:hypothetical protein
MCALLWFLPTVRAQETNRVLTRKDYAHIAMFHVGFERCNKARASSVPKAPKKSV